MSVSKRLRYEVLRRDEHTCRYCGGQAPEVKLTVDHVIPVSLGGTDDASNLVAACRDCNAGKSSVSPDQPLVDQVSADAVRWGAAMSRAAEIQSAETASRTAYVDAFDAAWLLWHVQDRPFERDPDWRRSIGRWHDMGIEIESLVDLANDVLPRRGISEWNMWKYFCGSVWRMVQERQEIAQGLIETGECP